MKKILIIIVALVMTFLSGCQKTSTKFLLETEVGLDKTIELDLTSLESKIDTGEGGDNFILYVYVEGCTSCLSFTKQVLNPYIKETGARIYSCKRSVAKSFIKLKDNEASPLLVVFNDGKVVDKTGMLKSPEIFNSIEGLKSYLDHYVVVSKMKYIKEEELELLIKNENVLVYFSWNECGDCKAFNLNFMNDYLLNNKNEKVFYIIETAPFRENPDKWMAWKEKYGLTSYYQGRVPSLVYYENGVKKDMAVYLNDMMEIDEKGINIIGSYYDDAPFISKTYQTYDDYKKDVLEFHNQKIKEFLEKYYE